MYEETRLNSKYPKDILDSKGWSGLASFGSVLCVESIKRPKHAVHDELMTSLDVFWQGYVYSDSGKN